MGLGFVLRRYRDQTYAWHNGASLGGYAELWLGASQSLPFCTNASVDLAALAERALDGIVNESSWL